MTDKAQIIIDGVDVSKCQYFDSETKICSLYTKYFGFQCKCKHFTLSTIDGEEFDCYFKQLAHKTAECEELKKQDYKNLKIIYNDFKQIKLLREECARYRKALEEIEEIAKSFNKNKLCFYKEIDECDCCDMGADCNYLRRAKILYIISKAKENNNEN